VDRNREHELMHTLHLYKHYVRALRAWKRRTANGALISVTEGAYRLPEWQAAEVAWHYYREHMDDLAEETQA